MFNLLLKWTALPLEKFQRAAEPIKFQEKWIHITKQLKTINLALCFKKLFSYNAPWTTNKVLSNALFGKNVILLIIPLSVHRFLNL